MKKHIAQFKIIVLILVISLGASYASAFGPTAPAPGNNVGELIEQSIKEQSKGGSSLTGLGILLDVDDSSTPNDIFSMTSVGIMARITVNGDTYVNTLVSSGKVCADSLGKLIDCYSYIVTYE